jgi:ketosteroid isomerase-like protein
VSDFHAACQRLFDRYVSAYRNGDAAGCAAIFAPDAEMYSPFGPPAIGRDAIAAQHQDWVTEGADGKKLTVVASGQSGDLGWCAATFSERQTGDGHTLAVLARNATGEWDIIRCSLTEA